MTEVTSHSLQVRAKAERFDVEDLHNYSLSISVGIRDIQLAITESSNNDLMLIEDYQLNGVKSVNTRIEAIDSLFSE